MLLRHGLILVALAGVAAQGATAQGRGRGNPPSRGAEQRAERSNATIIVEWFTAHPGDRPPGWGKKSTLPPGLARQLQRNGTLPPGLRKKVLPLPGALIRALPPLRSGREYLVVENRVLVVERPTWAILDVVVVL